MFDPFEKHLKHKKRMSSLENTDTPEKLVQFCIQILKEEGYETEAKEKPKLYTDHYKKAIEYGEIIDERYSIDPSYLQMHIEMSKRQIASKIMEELIDKQKLIFKVEKRFDTLQTIVVGKLEI